MATVTTRVFGAGFETSFKTPVLYRDAHCEELAKKFFEALASYGVKPPQIALRQGDSCFNYDLTVLIFNGNGIFKVSSEKLEIRFDNALGDKDFEIITDCVAKVYEHVPLPDITYTSISATVHVTFDSIAEQQKYMSRYADPERQIVQAGIIAYMKCKSWPEEIRLTVDQSLAYQDGIFLSFVTRQKEGKVTRDSMNKVASAFVEATSGLDLIFPENKPQ